MWNIGQKVICLKNFSSISLEGRVKKDPPKKDELYTIKEIREYKGDTYLTLKETEYGEGMVSHDYWDRFFVPLSDYKQYEEAMNEELTILIDKIYEDLL